MVYLIDQSELNVWANFVDTKHFLDNICPSTRKGKLTKRIIWNLLFKIDNFSRFDHGLTDFIPGNMRSTKHQNATPTQLNKMWTQSILQKSRTWAPLAFE